MLGVVPAAYAAWLSAAILCADHPGLWVREGGPLEMFQLGCWIAAAGVAVGWLALHVGSVGRPDRRAAALLAWLATIAALAGSRELDLHTLLNPATLGPWGVRYRLDWWLDPAQSLAVKSTWAALVILAAAAFVLPAVASRTLITRLVRRRGAAFWTMLGAIACLAGGYAADDLLGRGRFVAPGVSQVAEEALEGLGALLFAQGVWIIGRAVRAGFAAPDDARGRAPHSPADCTF